MEKKIAKELESKGGEVRVFSYMLIIFSLIIIFFGTVFIVGRKDFAKIKKQQVVLDNNSKKIKNNIYKISSNSGNVNGVAKISKESNGKLKVKYFIHLTENLSSNKKCFNNGEGDKEHCRWIDFYNYAVSVGNDEEKVSGRLYPIFCSAFENLNKDYIKLYDAYNSCWQGKEKTQFKQTDKFFVKITAFYPTVEDFLLNKTIKIFDAKDYTQRSNIKKGKTTKIIERVDTEGAVKSGKIIKTLDINIKQ